MKLADADPDERPLGFLEKWESKIVQMAISAEYRTGLTAQKEMDLRWKDRMETEDKIVVTEYENPY